MSGQSTFRLLQALLARCIGMQNFALLTSTSESWKEQEADDNYKDLQIALHESMQNDGSGAT